MRLFIGFIFSFIIAFAALIKNSLNYSGFIGAIILGTSIYFFGGLYLSSIMISFFISSSVFTKFKEDKKKRLEEIHTKTGGRDYVQVLANGGLGLLYALMYFITKNPLFILCYAAAFAAANADTWSSEIGVLSKTTPVSILSFKKVETGVSGAISLLGTIAAFCGSLFIAIVFFVGYIFTFGWNANLIYYLIIIMITGFSGSIIDSILGASIQARYRCRVCGKITERTAHHGIYSEHIGGYKSINNDAVNFLSCFLASIIALLTAF